MKLKRKKKKKKKKKKKMKVKVCQKKRKLKCFEDETFLNTGEKPGTFRYQGTLTILMTFFHIELLYSVMICSETKNELFLAEICLVSLSTILFKTAKGIPYYSFSYCSIRVLCSIRFSITPLSTLTLESEVLKEEEEEIKISFEDETVEPLEEEEEVVLATQGEREMASEDENDFLGDFSNTNYESIVLYR